MRINWKKDTYFGWRRKFYARFKLQNGITLSAIQGYGTCSHNFKTRIAKKVSHMEIAFLRDGKLMRINKVSELFPDQIFADVWPDDSIMGIYVTDLKRFVKKYLR